MLDAAGKKAKDVPLAETIFKAEVKPHLIHEAVRAEQAGARAGTRATKSRGLVSGGRSKPWRQKGTGRARGRRASQWTGGGMAFAISPRSFAVKVNRKARKAALRGALSHHAGNGSLAVLDRETFGDEPSTRKAVGLASQWGKDAPRRRRARGADAHQELPEHRPLARRRAVRARGGRARLGPLRAGHRGLRIQAMAADGGGRGGAA